MVEVAKTDILLDQIYSYDQGYNALEAMALGKVVFTGGEKIFLKHYKISEDEVVINTLPDINYLVKKMSYLLNNPNEIKRIGRNAKKFVIKYHDSEKISGKYDVFHISSSLIKQMISTTCPNKGLAKSLP